MAQRVRKLPPYSIIPSDRGYDEVVFDKIVPIGRRAIDLTNQLVLEALELTPADLPLLDWRDPWTLWVWDTVDAEA